MTAAPILQVEDDQNDVTLLAYAFNKARITTAVQVVNDGRQAMDYLAGTGQFSDRTKYPLPCLLLLDLKLPGVSGFELLEWIRQQPALRTLVVIVFTSSSRPEDIERAYSLGANSCIVKPPDIQQRQEIAEYLKGWWLKYNQFATPSEGI